MIRSPERAAVAGGFLAYVLAAASACTDEEPEITWCEMPEDAACWPDVRDCPGEGEICVRDPSTDEPACVPKCFGDFECHAGFECTPVDAPGYCEFPKGEYACFEVTGTTSG